MGLTATIIRETPSFAAYFTAYEACCSVFGVGNDETRIGPVLLSGGVAGIVAWIVSLGLTTR